MKFLPALALALAAFTATAAERLVLPAAVLERAASGEAARDAMAAFARHAAAQQPGLLVAEARRRLDAAADDPALAARLLHGALLQLASVAPDTEARAFVAEARSAEAAVYLQLDETGHAVAMPAWDPAAAAQFVERRWAERAARATASAHLAAGEDLVPAWLAVSPGERRGFIEAIGEATPGQVALALPGLDGALAAGEPVGSLALAAAARTGDAALFVRALAAAPPRDALRTMREDLPAFPASERVSVLEAAIARSELASAALLALADEADSEPAAETLLWRTLGDPVHGASAAAALARMADGRVQQRLADIVAQDEDEARVRWARLALDLHQPAEFKRRSLP